ncbi:DUF397 domain-containing protein [Streptomyces sp. NWU339]|uniref:DUF397 domain-containing protein n=1 Tax=Streptomyces sp. NWU339 TaxID=2185284 RepID=UPI000D680A87|nr:DUF397 domain-containing protein [Streptomyces sp. NWU339]PWI09324.1 DUF397 domain-containing protein [Streptomyces sp. NWU339]
MPRLSWQKSSYCGEGDSCVHVATTAQAIHITESADPSGAILTTTPGNFLSLLQVLKGEREMTVDRPPAIDVTVEDDLTVRIHAGAPPGATVTTDRRRWDTFVLGVRAGEFDHFVAEP